MGPFESDEGDSEIEELNFEGAAPNRGCVCDFYCDEDCDCLCHEWDSL